MTFGKKMLDVGLQSWIYFFAGYLVYVMPCAIWFSFVQFKERENLHGGVPLLVWLQVLAFNFTKSNTPSGDFSTYFKLYKWYQIAENISYKCAVYL